MNVLVTGAFQLNSGEREQLEAAGHKVFVHGDERAPVDDEMLRALALTIPAVTEEVKPKGLPTASTHSPTLSFSLSPIGITWRLGASILIKARSVVASEPITVAL